MLYLSLFRESRCQNEPHTTTIRYDRQFLLHLADKPLSRVRPANLPDWVPTRDEPNQSHLRRRGKRGGVRQRVRMRGHRPPLPTITLSNVRSIMNKMDELRANVRYDHEYRNSSLICLTETWLHSDIHSNIINIPGFDVERLDRSSELTNKKRGGGICVFVNRMWCNNFTLRSSVCCKDIELLSISFRPFYLPREFPQVHVILVYIPPDADKDNATQIIQEKVGELETRSPDAPAIILGDFNHCQLEPTMPHYHQFVDVATRGENILDRCYSSIPNAYKALVRPGIGASDHHVIHLLPKYRQRLKTEKHEKRNARIWNETSIESLQTGFEITDWELFWNACDDIHELADTINSYVVFCENLHIQSKSVTVFSNNKPWITKELKLIMKERKRAFKLGDKELVKKLTNNIKQKVSEAKKQYGEKLENCFHSNNPRDAWKCLELMTDYSDKRRENVFANERDPQLRANELNIFFSRFDQENFQHLADERVVELRDTQDPPITIEEREVRKRLKMINPRKATGPDGVSGRVLQTCSSQLATPYCMLFQMSIDEHVVPKCWKASVIIPVPKTKRPISNNDFRPIALTPIVMKSFERIVLEKLLRPIRENIDDNQFAYQPKRSVIDAVLTLTNTLYQHTDAVRCYARATFVDFSSAFNTIQPYKLIEKLKLLDVKPSLVLWIYDFLHGRTQRVKVNSEISDEITTNTGTPQGCVLSPSLYILYTNDCVSDVPSVHILKYADDTVIVGLIKESEEDYRESIVSFGKWCTDNHLVLNLTKTKEMIFDFRKKSIRNPTDFPIHIDNVPIEIVHNYRYLGTVIDDQLNWSDQTKATLMKCNQRLYYLRKMKQFHVNERILYLFYTSVIQSTITHDSIVWFHSAKQKETDKLRKVVKRASKIMKREVDLDEICQEKVFLKAESIVGDESHPLRRNYTLLRSGRRWQSVRARTTRYSNSFLPYSIRLLNES